MSEQYSIPGSQSLAPFVGKRSWNVDETAETVTRDDDWEDARRQKRAKTPEISGSSRMQADSFGFPSGYGSDQNNRWAGPSIPEIQGATTSLPGFLPTFPASEPDSYGPEGLGYAVSSAQGQNAFHIMYTGLIYGQGGGGPMGPDVIAPHLVTGLVQDGIKPLDLSDDPAPMILEPMTIDFVAKDKLAAAPSPPRLEITIPLELPRAEDAKYNTCFGVVGNPPNIWFFLCDMTNKNA